MPLRIKKNEFGWYLELYFKISEKCESVYCNNKLISTYVGIKEEELQNILLENGAVDTANYITYFDSEEKAQLAIPTIDETILTMQTYNTLSGNNKNKKFGTILD